ncbi:MAG: glycosyltransferase [bacterium]|nr:glycosyltransferase [bacterium]
MRIGIFTNNYKPIVGGLTVSIVSFRQGLERLGHDVYVFAPRFEGYKETDKRVFRYPSAPIKYKTQYPIAIHTNKDQKYFADAKIDLVHALHPWVVGKYGLRLARRFRVPIVFTNHTMYPLYIDYVPKILPRRLAMGFIERSAMRFANKVDAVIAPTRGVKEYLQRNGVKKPIYVVPSGIEQKSLRKTPPAGLRKRFGIPKDHKILLNLSRISPEKNLPLILEAYQKVLMEYPKTSLVMAGGGPYLETLKGIARQMGLESKVFFTGLVQMDQRGGYFKEGDIFVHSSLSETQGLILIDSMAVGVPIVAVKATGVVDVVEDGQSGLLTDGSADALAKGVLRLLRDDKLREKLAKGASQRAKEYTIEKTSRKLEEVYKEVLNSF